MMQLVCASANPDKVVEIQRLLDGVVELLPRPAHVADVVEDAGSLLGNARLKAAALCAATGMPAVADDTGLEVEALGGAPGVDAAHYAGEGCSYADNRAKLLAKLEGVSRSQRRVQDGGDRRVAGRLRAVRRRRVPRRDHHRGARRDRLRLRLGVPARRGWGATFAEMGVEAKNAISHRGRAFRALLTELAQR
jgi:XTP/dITP diphosphohydrolase